MAAPIQKEKEWETKIHSNEDVSLCRTWVDSLAGECIPWEHSVLLCGEFTPSPASALPLEDLWALWVCTVLPSPLPDDTKLVPRIIFWFPAKLIGFPPQKPHRYLIFFLCGAANGSSYPGFYSSLPSPNHWTLKHLEQHTGVEVPSD